MIDSSCSLRAFNFGRFIRLKKSGSSKDYCWKISRERDMYAFEFVLLCFNGFRGRKIPHLSLEVQRYYGSIILMLNLDLMYDFSVSERLVNKTCPRIIIYMIIRNIFLIYKATTCPYTQFSTVYPLFLINTRLASHITTYYLQYNN